MTSATVGQTATRWFSNRDILQSLPPLYRLYAFYSRLMWNEQGGRVRKGRYVHGQINRLARLLRRRDTTLVKLSDFSIMVDLLDFRMPLLLDEVQCDTRVAKVIRERVRPGDAFLDVGANHGTYSMLAGSLVGREGQLHAFEPQPRLASLLRESFRVNGFPSAQVHQVACSDRAGETTFYIPAHNSGEAGLLAQWSANSAHREISVKLARIDEVLTNVKLPERVFIKMDVEGHELGALKGARGVIEAAHPTILFELNPVHPATQPEFPHDEIAFLHDCGYRRFHDLSTYPERVEPWSMTYEGQRNILAIYDGEP